MPDEPKMCPLLAAALVARGVGVDRDDAPCRREACAWWVEGTRWDLETQTKIPYALCAIPAFAIV